MIKAMRKRIIFACLGVATIGIFLLASRSAILTARFERYQDGEFAVVILTNMGRAQIVVSATCNWLITSPVRTSSLPAHVTVFPTVIRAKRSIEVWFYEFPGSQFNPPILQFNCTSEPSRVRRTLEVFFKACGINSDRIFSSKTFQLSLALPPFPTATNEQGQP